MLDKIVSGLSVFIIATISMLGYGGVVLMMAIESACIPLPSEIIMPFSGYLVATGQFGLQMVAIAGATGCLLGSYVAYFVGSGAAARSSSGTAVTSLSLSTNSKPPTAFSRDGVRTPSSGAACCR